MNGGLPEIHKNLINGNSATLGGGLYIFTGENALIYANLISGNTAGESGGGVFANNSMSNFYNNSVVDNSASVAYGGLRVGGTLDSIINCIVYNNGSTPVNAGGTVEYSCIEGGYSTGTGNVSADPQFIDSDNDDYHLAYNSPCIDAGMGGGPTADYDSNGTNQDGNNNGTSAFDMGAFEFMQDVHEFNAGSGNVSYDLNTFEPGASNTVTQITLNSPNITSGDADSIFVNIYTKSRPLSPPPASKAVNRWLEIVRQTDVDFSSADLRIYYAQEEFETSGLISENNLSIFWYNSSGGNWMNIGVSSRSIVDNYVQTNNISPSYFSTTNGTYFALADLADSPLPVLISSFTGEIENNIVVLHWITESELMNTGFEIYRSENDNVYDLIASYKSNDNLLGLGNSSRGTNYSFTDLNIRMNKDYFYKLYNIDFSGVKNYVGKVCVNSSEIDSDEIISEFQLLDNYPNPFNAHTSFQFYLPEKSQVMIEIFNTKGQKIDEVPSFGANPGRNVYNLDALNYASGIYLYKFFIQTYSGEKEVRSGRMIIIK